MTTAVTKSSLLARRQQFRRRQWLWRLLGLWRLTLAGLLAGGFLWLARAPFWHLSSIVVEGNRALSEERILAALDLHLPETVLHVDPQQLQERLQRALPLRSARVRRQLLPPALFIHVEERQTVAAAPLPGGRLGLIDAEGFWSDAGQYVTVPKPALTVWGFDTQKIPLWRRLYPQIAASPVIINVVDLRRVSDLVLRTELGEVRLGAFGPQFSEQLRQLDQMRGMTARYKAADIAFIDLRSSGKPTIRLRTITP